MTRYAREDVKRLKDAVDTLSDRLANANIYGGHMQEEGIRLAEHTLFEEITPEFIYVLSIGDSRSYPALVWGAAPADLREWLPNDVEAVVWKVSRTDPTDSVDVTDDFARTWINDRGDFHDELEEYLRKLGPWLSTHYDDLAREMYLDAQVRDGD